MFKHFSRKKKNPSEKISSAIKQSVRNGAKDILTGTDSLSFSGSHKLIKEEINKNAYEIIKDSIDSPETLLNYIQTKGTLIVKSKYMEKILRLFGDEPGFITPKSGMTALLFTFLLSAFSRTKVKIGKTSPPLFALKDEPINIYILAHQFHLWLSYTSNLPGFEEKTIKNFKNFWKLGPDSNEVSFLSVDEIFSLKDIIARELEALNFVKELGREFEGRKKCFKSLNESGSVDL